MKTTSAPKLTLRRTTLKHLSVHTGVQTGYSAVALSGSKGPGTGPGPGTSIAASGANMSY